LAKDDESTATCCYGLGFAYYHTMDYHKSLTYYQKGLVLNEGIGDKFGTAVGYNNIADICLKIADVDKALEFALKALDLLEEAGQHEDGFASEFQITVGDIYLAQGLHDKAEERYLLALQISRNVDYIEGQIFSNTKLGEFKLRLKLPEEACEYLERGMNLSHEAGNITEERKCRDLLAQAYAAD